MSQPSRPSTRGFSFTDPPSWAWMTLVFAVTLIAYAATLRAGFVWNDSDYVTRPELQSWRGLWRIWFDVGSTEQHYPLLHGAFWVEHRLWGDAAAGYHLVNLLLHAGSACLFALVLRRLAVPGAWFAALLFALHPVCVESVAWVSEQKNTLSTLLYLAAGLAYLHYEYDRDETTAPGRPDRLRSYRLATLLFVAALLAKSLTATLPAALLVLTWWRHGRVAWRDVRPLIPWFVLGAAMGLFSAWVEHEVVGGSGADFDLTPLQRLLVAGRAPWFYLYHTLWPAGLIFIYPRWEVRPTEAAQWLWPLALVATLVVLWWIRRCTRAPLAVALLFLGLLFPVIGFFSLYAVRYSFVADHWQYLPTLPVIAAIGALAVRLAGAPLWRAPAVGAAVLLVLGALTFRQTLGYHDIVTFYRTILARNPGCWMANANLGNTYLAAGDNADAAAQFAASIKLRPDAGAQSNLGNALFAQNMLAQAIEQYRAALALDPNLPEAHNNYATAALRLGRLPEALDHYQRAIALNPDYAEAHGNLGYLLTQLGQPQAAVEHLIRARSIHPLSADIHDNLGSALLAVGRVDDAIVSYHEALRLKPDFDVARTNLGNALLNAGRVDEAIAEYQTVLGRNPSDLGARVNLGNAFAQARRPADAIAQYEYALRVQPNFAEGHNNLGYTLLQLGRAAEAAVHFRQALAIRPDYREARANLTLAEQAAARSHH